MTKIQLFREQFDEHGSTVKVIITLPSADQCELTLNLAHHELYPKWSDWHPFQWGRINQRSHVPYEEILSLLGGGDVDRGETELHSLVSPYLVSDRDDWVDEMNEFLDASDQNAEFEKAAFDRAQERAWGRF